MLKFEELIIEHAKKSEGTYFNLMQIMELLGKLSRLRTFLVLSDSTTFCSIWKKNIVIISIITYF